MKLIIVAVFLASAFADKLPRTYLPASPYARSAGGAEFLTAPGFDFGKFNHYEPAPSKSFRSYGGLGRINDFITPVRSSQFNSGPAIPILRMNSDNKGDGTYKFAYETDNKIVQEEEGHVKNVGPNNEANIVHGAYSYQAPDGQVISVNYVADENGFRATGDHIPTPPPVPEAIQKSIDVNIAEEKAHHAFGVSAQPYEYSGGRSYHVNRSPINFIKPFDVSGVPSARSEEFDDLSGVEVGVPEDNSRQYLPPQHSRFGQNGYRF